jgi:hypothetical protein
MPPGVFSVGRQKIGPARGQIPRDVLHDDGNGVRIRIEREVEFIIRYLSDGSVGQAFIRLEGVADCGQ